MGTTETPHATPLPPCLMPESFTGSGEFEDYLQQFNTAANLWGRYSTTHDNRPHYFALRLTQNALHIFTTLSVAQQKDITLLVDAFRQKNTTNVDILKARLKASRQQSNQDIASFLCDVRALARRAYRAFPHLVEQIILTSFIEGFSDSTRRWELRKSKAAAAEDTLTMAMEFNSFLEIEKGAPPKLQTSETTGNLISQNPSDQNSNDLMDQFVRTFTEKLNKAMPSTEKSRDSRSISVDSSANKSVCFRTNNNGNKKNQNSQQNRERSPGPKKSNKGNNKKEPCKHCTL